MKRLILSVVAVVLPLAGLRAQVVVPEGFEVVDSLIYTPVSAIDESLEGKDIWSVMPANVNVSQSAAIADSLARHISLNGSKKVNGYRIRIFFDNKRESRQESEAIERRFRTLFHGYNTYRSFSSPFFKVTVGDFRTKTEANAALREIKPSFPSAFVVKERFRFPALDQESYQVDTIRIVRRIMETQE